MNYNKIYLSIINNAKKENRDRKEKYYEKHHILPKCIGGSDSLDNLIYLTPKEHFLCHRLLCEIYPNELKLKFALWYMSNNKKYIISSRIYEKIRKNISNEISGKTIETLYGTEKAKEMREKMSSSRKGKSWVQYFGLEKSIDLKEKLIGRRIGSKHTKETIEKMKKSSLNENTISIKKKGFIDAKEKKFLAIKEQYQKEIKNFYLNGKSIYSISKILNVSRYNIKKIIRLL